MLREFLSGVTLTDLPVVAMCLFFVIFLAALLRVSQRRRFKEYDRMSQLPLQDEPSCALEHKEVVRS